MNKGMNEFHTFGDRFQIDVVNERWLKDMFHQTYFFFDYLVVRWSTRLVHSHEYSSMNYEDVALDY